MKTTARIIELLLTAAAIAYSGAVTRKWVSAEREASYLRGQWSVYESMAEMDPRKLPKW